MAILLITRDSSPLNVAKHLNLTAEVYAILQQPDTWYLVDSVPRPGEYGAIIVLVSSPRKDNYRKFIRYDGVRSSYMPIWSNE
jgi:hypothetical protein